MTQTRPAIPLATLREQVSENGHRYFTGHLGNARIVMTRSAEVDTEDGADIWDIFVLDGPDQDPGADKDGKPRWRRPVVPDYALPDPL